VLLPRQQAKLARGTKDKERAMSQTSNTAIAVIGKTFPVAKASA
jgi:transposase